MVDYYQKSKSWYSLAMTNCSILKPLLKNLMEFFWNLMECFDLLTPISLFCLSSCQKPPYTSKLIWFTSFLDVKTQICQMTVNKAICLKLFVTPVKCTVPLVCYERRIMWKFQSAVIRKQNLFKILGNLFSLLEEFLWLLLSPEKCQT